MSMFPDEARRLRCDRDVGRCVLEAAGEERVIDLASIDKAHVSHSRSSGYSLQLVTAKGTDTLSKRTMSSDSRSEYEAAADEINAMVAERADSVDVEFTYRAGLMPGVAIASLGLGFAAFGLGRLRAS